MKISVIDYFPVEQRIWALRILDYSFLLIFQISVFLQALDRFLLRTPYLFASLLLQSYIIKQIKEQQRKSSILFFNRTGGVYSNMLLYSKQHLADLHIEAKLSHILFVAMNLPHKLSVLRLLSSQLHQIKKQKDTSETLNSGTTQTLTSYELSYFYQSGKGGAIYCE